MKKKSKYLRKHANKHYGSVIIAIVGIMAIFGILLYNPAQPVAHVTAKVKLNFDFYCGYDSDHDLLMCAPELSAYRYSEIVGLSYSENIHNNILAVYYDEKQTDASGVSAVGEVQIYYDDLAVAFTCKEAYDACRQGYGKACIVNSLCPK